MTRQGRIERRLVDARADAERLRAELRVVEEQAAYQRDEAEGTRTRSLVSDDGTATREHRAAQRHADRTAAQAGRLRERIAALAAEQDELLERLLAPSDDARSRR